MFTNESNACSSSIVFFVLVSALLRLDREVKFTNLLKPACMPTRGKSFSHLDVRKHKISLQIMNYFKVLFGSLISIGNCNRLGCNKRLDFKNWLLIILCLSSLFWWRMPFLILVIFLFVWSISFICPNILYTYVLNVL